ncbi:hypothetical protein FHG87_020820 [Trinorchestia longiramus]|nr:hypothetical protein FHG87_020820 [Trinorchestia longiramus]
MSSREGGQGRGGAGHTARSLLPTPVNSRPPRLHIAEPLPRRINTTTHQNTTQHSNNHSTNNHNTRPTYNHKKTKIKKKQETEKNNRTYLDIAKTAIQQTNQPTPALTLSSNTHIKLAALVIEAHITSLAKTESYGTILSKSLKRNFNIDTSFLDRDSQKIFNLFINPTPDPEPASIATPNTNTETISTRQDMESESEQSSTETNDTQDQNSDNTEPEQPWETRTKKKQQKKGRKPAHLPTNNRHLTPTNSKPLSSKAQHNTHRSQPTPPTTGSSLNSQKPTRKSRSK